MEEESGHHAVVGCTMATALRHEMRGHWSLPGEIKFRYTGPDWLMLLLRSVDDDMRAKVLLLLWRVWYILNDIMHRKGIASVAGSVEFLKFYAESLGIVEQKDPGWVSERGKEKVMEGIQEKKVRMLGEAVIGWSKPPPGWAKLNTDASYYDQMGRAGAWVVIRDADGNVPLSACKTLSHMASVERSRGGSVPRRSPACTGMDQEANSDRS
jgi:hypothetical protein